MARRIRSVVGIGVLAAVLFGAVMMAPCVAEEAHSGASGAPAERTGAPPVSGKDAARSATKLERGSGPPSNGVAGKASIGEPAAAKALRPVDRGASSPAPHPGESIDLRGIDTRITVVPRRLGGERDKAGNIKPIKIVPASLPARPKPPPAGFSRRNAIGVSVARPGSVERRIDEHPNLLTGMRGPSLGAKAVSPAASGPLAKGVRIEAGIQRPAANANSIFKSALSNRGAISGTTLRRPGSGASEIGGPAKTVAGINGTAIRPRY